MTPETRIGVDEMNLAVSELLILPAISLVAMVLLPSHWANAHAQLVRRLVTTIAGIQFILAAVLLAVLATRILPAVHTIIASFPTGITSIPSIELSVHYDGVSSLMFALVSFVAWVNCRYSIRYLDGEGAQGRYYRWTAFTIGSVLLTVVSGNLLMFVATWIMTGLGLHQLLLHYGDRPAARRAAWTKFVISRLGDFAIIAATILIFSEFKTLDFAKLFEATETLPEVTLSIQAAAFLLVAGAVTKSAQFPFHTWLPLTMETPTPVSALMHAGIVNAGGYLMIRTSPIVSLSPLALTSLALLGAFTACFAAVVMLTQTSIKKSLAYSTIAQMGFMLLQCGLGAYSAAMLHIVAHSLYKAHAFLSSGSVLSEPAKNALPKSKANTASFIELAIVALVLTGVLGVSLTIFGIDPTRKPGGLMLGALLCLSLTHWVGQVMRNGNQAHLLRAILIASGSCLVYSASYFAVDKLLWENLPVAVSTNNYWLASAIILVGFASLFLLNTSIANNRDSAFLQRWQIHASNGFYVESTLRRMFG